MNDGVGSGVVGVGLIADPFRPARLGPITLRNRVIKAATFEGMAPGGDPSDRLIEFHRRFAAGGVGMTTVAYCSVSPEGRTYEDQLWMRPEIIAGLRRLTDAVHREGAAAALQLGHAGSFANPKASGIRAIAPSRAFSTWGLRFAREMTASDIERLVSAFGAAARAAVEAGFDAVEVHLGHGYLLSQFLSPHANRRTDGWGGSLENRGRFPRAALRAVREAVADRAAVTAKLNMLDGFRGGMPLSDGIEMARILASDGTVDAIELTGGFTSRNPMFLMRGEVPFRELVETEPGRLRRFALKRFAPRVVRPYPFEEAFFLPLARQVRAAVDVPLILLGGITKRSTIVSALADGFEFVAMARALLREPDLISRYASGSATDALCIPCNKCVTQMNVNGTRCVFVPEEF